MNRINVAQSIINKLNAIHYLEIGVSTGKTLDSIKAKKKVGVDPFFNFNQKRKVRRLLGIYGAKLYEIESDEFFKKHASLLFQNRLDVAFIDGLHTYKQALADVENCLKFLNKKGVIVMHDCNPPDAASAYPVNKSITEIYPLIKENKIPGWKGNWNGDVWKAIAILRITRNDLNIFTLDTDWGLGIITRGSSSLLENYTVSDIEKADYSLLEKNREEILNLKSPEFFTHFLEIL